MDLVAERIPWIVFESADWLRSVIKSDWKILEWGSGGSTSFFLSQTRHLVTVEHNSDWCKKVVDYVNDYNLYTDWDLFLRPPVDEPSRVISFRAKGSFKKYAQVVLKYHNLDLVFVDGRARKWCSWLAASRITPGGYLMLDNSERLDYKSIFKFLKNWQKQNFIGHGPLTSRIWQTTVWQKPIEKEVVVSEENASEKFFLENLLDL